MPDDCSCGEPLRESVVMTVGSKRLKSCPECSGRAGHHVFYDEASFGVRNMGGGRVIVQSWCPACRGGMPPDGPAAFEC